MILLYTRATELPVFSPWSFFLVSDQEPWPYPGEGPRAWAFLSPPLAPVPLAFTAARTLGVCFLFPFSCHRSSSSCPPVRTSFSAPVGTPVPVGGAENPKSLGHMKTDVPPQVVCIRGQIGGAGGGAAQGALLSVTLIRSRPSPGRRPLLGKGAGRQGPWKFLPEVQSGSAPDL